MKKAVGIIELLISFLLLSIIIGGFLHMTLVQMQDGKPKHTQLQDAQKQAEQMVDEIQTIKENNQIFEENLLNN